MKLTLTLLFLFGFVAFISAAPLDETQDEPVAEGKKESPEDAVQDEQNKENDQDDQENAEGDADESEANQDEQENDEDQPETDLAENEQDPAEENDPRRRCSWRIVRRRCHKRGSRKSCCQSYRRICRPRCLRWRRYCKRFLCWRNHKRCFYKRYRGCAKRLVCVVRRYRARCRRCRNICIRRG